MSEIEKRELLDQQRKIFEAGAQRADKRTGSFSFLTWSFFIAPLIAAAESPAATLKLAQAEEEDAKAVQASATPQATSDDSAASDLSKTSPDDEAARQPTASLEARAAQLDPTGVLTQLPHEDAPKPSIARNEPVAAAGGGGGGGGSSDDADSRSHDGHIGVDHSSLTAESSVEGFQLPAGSMLASVESGALINGSATLLGGLSTLTNDFLGTVGPTETTVHPMLAATADLAGTLTNDAFGTIVQPVLAATMDIAGTLTSNVVGTLGTLEASAQPVLTATTDIVGTLSNDLVGTIAPLEGTLQPALATVTDTVGTVANDIIGTVATLEATAQPVLATVSDALGTLASDVVATVATLEAAAQPVLATLTDTVGTLTNDVVGTVATLEATAQPVLATVSDTVGTLTSDVVGMIAPVEAAAQPALATVTEAADTLTNDVVGTITPVEAAAQPVLATLTDTAGALNNDVVSTVATLETTAQPVLTTASDTADTLTNDVAGTIAPVEAAAPTLLAAGADAASPVAADVLSMDVPVIAEVADQSHTNQLLSQVQSSAPEADPHVPATAGAVVDGVDATLAPAPGGDADPGSQAVADSTHATAAHIGSSVLISGTAIPLIPESDDASQASAPETTSSLTNHAVASVAPVVDTADPLLAAMTTQPTTSSHPASDGAAAHTPESSVSAANISETAPAAGNTAAGDVAQTGNVTADALPHAAAIDDAPVANAVEPVPAGLGISASNPQSNLLPLDMGDSGSGHASEPAATLLALATGDAPIEVPAAAVASANTTADTPNAPTAADATAITGDVIALNDAPHAPANALFTGTQYTDYGVTLSSDIVVPQQPAASSVDTTSTHDTLVQVVGDVQQHAPSTPDVDPTHSIDHLGLRDAIL